MSLQTTPQSERVHISFFGRRNAGKSSLVNAIAGQPVSLVSDILGTTTDPVRKSMEILPLGPVLLIDTPGIDDEGSLGEMRVSRSKEVIRETDIALLVLSAKVFLEESAEALHSELCFLPKREQLLLEVFQEEHIPVMLILSQLDRLSDTEKEELKKAREVLEQKKREYGIQSIQLSSGLSSKESANFSGSEAIKNTLAELLPKTEGRRLFSGLLEEGDYIVLVTPIDESAPKGRLILPQQMAIRDLLDYHAIPIVTQVEELKAVMESLGKKVKLVVTDSQAFKAVEKILEKDVPLTSFSILMARYKGFLSYALQGCAILDSLEDGDKIYIAEGCTHHRQCGDIGTVKLPKMLEKYSGKKLSFVFTEGKGFLPEEKRKELKLMIHCGACMLSEREVQSRYQDFLHKGIPICNYGLAMAKMTGILGRSVSMLPELLSDSGNIL
jgi:hydrogenase maturation GTPase hydF